MAAPVCRFLAERGFRVWVDPDGSNYFDIVAQRGDEVGLVELKLAAWKKLYSQALRRRGWGDWVAVGLPRASLAQRFLERGSGARTERIGVWLVTDQVQVLREARPWVEPGEADPFEPLRTHLRESLSLLDRGLLPDGTGWRFVRLPSVRPRSRPSLNTSEWRLEEFVGRRGSKPPKDGPPEVSPSDDGAE